MSTQRNSSPPVEGLPPGKHGFTLVELLVVVSVIGILAALLLTVLSRAKARARQAQCINNVRQLGLALQEFRTDHNSYPPNLDPSDKSENRNWVGALDYQMGQHQAAGSYTPKGVWDCPAANRPTGPGWENHGDWAYDDYNYNAWGLAGNSPTNSSLGLSEHYSQVGPDKLSSPLRRVADGEIVSPSDTLALGDALFGAPGTVVDGQVFGRASESSVSAFGFQGYDYAESTRSAYARHQGRANVVLCDGHVESMTLKILFEDASDAALSRWNRDHEPHRERLR